MRNEQADTSLSNSHLNSRPNFSMMRIDNGNGEQDLYNAESQIRSRRAGTIDIPLKDFDLGSPWFLWNPCSRALNTFRGFCLPR